MCVSLDSLNESASEAPEPTFQQELTALINKYSLENQSNTPDFLLAAFLENVLVDWAHATRARDKFYGHEHRIHGGI